MRQIWLQLYFYVVSRTDCIGRLTYFDKRRVWPTQTPGNTNANHVEIIMNKDQVKGRVSKTKGEIKEAVGKAVGDKSLEIEGKVQKIAGKSQAAYGDLKSDIKKDS